MDILQKAQAERIKELATSLTDSGSRPLSSRVGLTARETKAYSLTAAIRAKADAVLHHRSWSSLEAEADAAAQKTLGPHEHGGQFYVPGEVLERSRRDMTVGIAGAWGYLVGTRATSFIETL